MNKIKNKKYDNNTKQSTVRMFFSALFSMTTATDTSYVSFECSLMLTSQPVESIFTRNIHRIRFQFARYSKNHINLGKY